MKNAGSARGRIIGRDTVDNRAVNHQGALQVRACIGIGGGQVIPVTISAQVDNINDQAASLARLQHIHDWSAVASGADTGGELRRILDKHFYQHGASITHPGASDETS